MTMTAGVSSVIAVRDQVRGRIRHRYWPGRAPEWAIETDEDDVDLLQQTLDQAFPFSDQPAAAADDPRLRRLAESRTADHRRIRQAEEEEENPAEEAEEEHEDEVSFEERRRRIRETLKRRLEEEKELAPLEEEEYETVEDDDQFRMAKPVFVRKQYRRLEAEERSSEVAVKRRRAETKHILVEKIREEADIQKNVQIEANVDTDEEVNGAEEYECWKTREIARIKRDREEIERGRNMIEEERKNPNPNPKPAPSPKHKWRFMQKYYHKGAFFQSDTIFQRDFSAPTGEDKMDKTILPKVLQVKNFGRSGRTKWTHLVNEDTTDWNNPWMYNDPLRAKYNAKMAAMRPIAC